MPGFTSEEVQTAVDRFLLKQVAVSRLPVTGARDVLAVRDRIYDLLTTTLLLRTDSIFYLVWLGKNRLRRLVQQQISAVQEIDSWASGVSRASKRIDSTAELVNAQAAVTNLNAGLNARTSGVRGSIGPAVERFRSSIDRFVRTELTKNVVVSGVVTETAEELRARVASEWAQALERHDDIEAAVTNVQTVLAALEEVRLPESSIRDIVSRISSRLQEVQEELAGDSAIAQSREAMLELLTMRTLLTKVAGFRNPLRTLMPLTSDSTTLTLIDSAGSQAGLVGTISGPFNYDTGTTLDLSLNSGAATPSIALPGSSRAELRSQPLTFPSGPGGGASLAVLLDHAITVSFSPAASYASGAAAASDIDAGLGGGVSVTFDSATSQLVFTSAETGDASHIRLLSDTAAREQSAAWLLVGATEVAPVSTQDVVGAINAGSPDVEAEVQETFYASFTAERTAVIGEEDLLWDRRDTGADLVADGSTTVSSPSRNFEALGVQAGWGLVITAPAGSAGTFGIVDVDGPNLVLDAAVVTAAACTYYIGPDYSSVPAGARVQATGSEEPNNSGFYRVLSAGVAQVQTDLDLRGADASILVSIYSRFVSIEARGTTTSSGIGVLSPSTGATVLGFSVTASETVAGLSTFQLGTGDFLARGVKAGDAIMLTSPLSIVYNRVVASVTTSRLVIADPVPAESGAWAYTIQSTRHLSYDALQAGAAAYSASTYAGDDVSALDTVATRLIGGARYTSTLSAPLATYIADLQALLAVLDAYVIEREVSIDNIVQTMREQGLDRGTDVLLALDVEQFFTMSADAVSYKTNVVRKLATTGRLVTPVSKSAKSDRIVQELRPVSYQPNPYDPLAEDLSDL